MHLGHKTIIDQVKQAAQLGVPSVVMIFEPQPREFFQGGSTARADAIPPEVRSPLAEGVDMVLCIRFDETFRSYSGMGFIEDVLVSGLGVRRWWWVTTSASVTTGPAISNCCKAWGRSGALMEERVR